MNLAIHSWDPYYCLKKFYILLTNEEDKYLIKRRNAISIFKIKNTTDINLLYFSATR